MEGWLRDEKADPCIYVRLRMNTKLLKSPNTLIGQKREREYIYIYIYIKRFGILKDIRIKDYSLKKKKKNKRVEIKNGCEGY